MTIRVRSLDWEEQHHRRDDGDSATEPVGWEARDCFGDYYVVSIEADGLYVDHKALINGGGPYPSPDEAKTAAQADYERRILSALSAPSTGQGAGVASDFGPGNDWDAAAHVRLLRGQGGASSGYTADMIERLHTAVATLTRERDEARDRAEELEDAAEKVSVEFEGECWAVLRTLLSECNFPWDLSEPDGVTAQEALDYIRETMSEADKTEGYLKARAEAAEAREAKLREVLSALDRMNRGVDWCDQDEQARRWAAARAALQTGEEG